MLRRREIDCRGRLCSRPLGGAGDLSDGFAAVDGRRPPTTGSRRGFGSRGANYLLFLHSLFQVGEKRIRENVKPVPKGTAPKRFVLRAVADRKDFIKLSQALSQLFGLCASMNLRVEVDARQPAGFDPVKLRNSVQEPLTEAGIEHDGMAGQE
jgi:hypothetical protein